MNLLEFKVKLLKPINEFKMERIFEHRYHIKSQLEIVRKIEDFKFKLHRSEVEGKKQEVMKYLYRIEALEWVLNGHAKTK